MDAHDSVAEYSSQEHPSLQRASLDKESCILI